MRLRPPIFMRISITYLYVIFEYGYPHSMRLCAEMLETAQTRAA